MTDSTVTKQLSTSSGRLIPSMPMWYLASIAGIHDRSSPQLEHVRVAEVEPGDGNQR